jgi:uncharacterized protein (DUF2336 family)
MSVRRKLAERLARDPKAPIELIAILMRDDIEVARAILVENAALRDADLVEVIEQKTMQHRLAIATRRSVSETVSAALVAAGEDEVARTLLENPGAKIARNSYVKLVERSRDAAVLQEPLIRRHDLEPELAGRMYAWVSVALRRYIVQHFEIERGLVDEAIRHTLDDVASEHAESAARGSPQERIVETLIERRGEDPQALLNLLRAGEIGLFEALFARLTHLKPQIARRTIYEQGGRALAIACKASDIDKSIFAAILLLARQARPGDKSVDPTELPTALAFYDSLPRAQAEESLHKLILASERRHAH